MSGVSSGAYPLGAVYIPLLAEGKLGRHAVLRVAFIICGNGAALG